MEPYPPRRQSRQEMVTFPPYTASTLWYATWANAISKNMTDVDAIIFSNNLCGISGKDFARCKILSGGKTMTLSTSVEGGSHSLNIITNLDIIKLSNHGNWPHVHLGALEAAYGRSPYYIYLMDEIVPILKNVPVTLGELNRRLHSALSGMLPAIQTDMKPSVKERGKEIATTLNPHLSILDALMRHGPETILAFPSLMTELVTTD